MQDPEDVTSLDPFKVRQLRLQLVLILQVQGLETHRRTKYVIETMINLLKSELLHSVVKFYQTTPIPKPQPQKQRDRA